MTNCLEAEFRGNKQASEKLRLFEMLDLEAEGRSQLKRTTYIFGIGGI